MEGRQFPVDVYYCYESVDDYVDAALLTCLQVYQNLFDHIFIFTIIILS